MDIEINAVRRIRDKTYFQITAEHGEIDATYSEWNGIYLIRNFDVSLRRHGIGKELLHRSYDHARDMGARGIIAAIISRECLDAMTSVFGEESIHIDKIGGYAPDGEDFDPDNPTSAGLYLRLDTDS